jgi:hypothetical protein
MPIIALFDQKNYRFIIDIMLYFSCQEIKLLFIEHVDLKYHIRVLYLFVFL